MLHALKRKTARNTDKQEPVNAEFDHMRQNLDNVSKALQTSLSNIDKAEESWKSLVSGTEHFSSGLHSLYPLSDDARDLFKKTLDELRDPLKSGIAEVNGPTSKVKSIERVVRAYLTEIKTLAGEYHNVEAARKDYALYQTKVDKLGKNKETEPSKQERNLEKLENAKAKYNSVLEGTVHRMRTTYEKAPTMFKAAYVAFWLYHSKMTEITGKHMKPSFDFANTNADSLFTSTQVGSSATTPKPH